MFNSLSMTRFAASIAEAMDIPAPAGADRPIPQVKRLVQNTLGGRADRVMIYNPDAISMWLVQKYTEAFAPVMERTQLMLPVSTVMPSVTPVCFATMYTGTLPEVHGIRAYEKPIVKIDSLFDTLARSGKRVGLVTVTGSSMDKIFAGRDIQYFSMPYDENVIKKAKELIEADSCDVVVAYNQEFDDIMHETTPESEKSMAAVLHHIAAFELLADTAKLAWAGHNSLVCWASDHGIHTSIAGHGDHGEQIEDDINVFHFYGAQPSHKEA